MMNETPNYYTITPASVRYDKGLSMSEIVMYGEITALANKTGFCSASNHYFAKLYSVSKETVSRWISNLQKRGHIEVVIKRNEKGQITKRSIGIDKNVNRGIDKNVKVNNTSINNTSNNKPPISPKGESKFAEFYKKYPVKKGKKLAKDRWERKKLDNKFDLIIKDIESRLNNDKQWLAGYIPHASTYIGREVWLDEIDTGKQNIDWESL